MNGCMTQIITGPLKKEGHLGIKSEHRAANEKRERGLNISWEETGSKSSHTTWFVVMD